MSSPLSFEFGSSFPSTRPNSTEYDSSFFPKLNGGQNCDGVGSPRKIFSCKRCHYSTDRKNNLKRHMVAMHEVTSQRLECCGLRFLSKADLKIHNGRFHSEGYKCPVCGQHFVRKALLERHFSVHTGEKKFGCECGYRTSHKSNLERHYKTHLKDSSCFSSNQQCRTELAEVGSLRFHSKERLSHFGGTRDHTNISSFSRVAKISPGSHSNSVSRLSPLKALSSHPSVSFPSGTTRTSVTGTTHRLESPLYESEMLVKRKPNTMKRGFTVEEILRLDTGSKSGSLNSCSDKQRRDQLPSPHQPVTQIHNPASNLPRPFLGCSFSTHSLKSQSVLKPYPLYRGFSPLSSSSLTASYPSTSFSISTPSSLSSQTRLPLMSSSLLMSTSCSLLSSTSSAVTSSLSLRPSNDLSHPSASSSLPADRQTGQSTTHSSFFIGDILKRKDNARNNKKPSNVSHFEDACRYVDYSYNNEEHVSEEEQWDNKERMEEEWKIREIRENHHKNKILEYERKSWNREEILHQHQHEPDLEQYSEQNEMEQKRNYYERQFLNENSDTLKENGKLYLLGKLPLPEHLTSKNLENKISDFTNYIHKKWRLKTSI